MSPAKGRARSPPSCATHAWSAPSREIPSRKRRMPWWCWAAAWACTNRTGCRTWRGGGEGGEEGDRVLPRPADGAGARGRAVLGGARELRRLPLARRRLHAPARCGPPRFQHPHPAASVSLRLPRLGTAIPSGGGRGGARLDDVRRGGAGRGRSGPRSPARGGEAGAASPARDRARRLRALGGPPVKPMEQLDALAMLGAIGHPVVGADASDRIVYANAAAERLFAWAAGELHGQLLDVLLAERLRGQHPGFFRNLLEESRGPQRVHAARKDGLEMDAEISLGSAGELLVISIRQLREDPRLPADERYRLVFDNAPVGLLHWDAKGVVTDCNHAMLEILGAPKQVVIGLNMLTLRGDPSREAIANLTRRTLDGKLARYEGAYKSQTGRKTTQVQALLAPIHGPAGI